MTILGQIVTNVEAKVLFFHNKDNTKKCHNNKPKSRKTFDICAKNFNTLNSQDAEILLRLLRYLPDARLAVCPKDALRGQEAQGERQVLLPKVDGGAGTEPH